MIGLGVIGFGYWGPNLVRNFMETPGCRVVAVSDLDPQRLGKARLRYPTLDTTADYRALLSDSRIDAVAISTPVSTHFELAVQALRMGKHVLVEKPMTASADEAMRLIDEADARGLVLAVDHTFVYTSAVRRMRELIAGDALGHIYYYDAVRANLGLFQHDVNVIWDLAVHDLSIMDYVLGQRPVAVSAMGMGHVPGARENIAYLNLQFEAPLIAHIHVNWLAPVKVRRTLIGGSRKMIVYDDVEPSEKVKVYDKGITLSDSGAPAAGTDRPAYALRVGYRSGDVWAPTLDVTEALAVEAQHFIDCIGQRRPPTADGQAGLRVVHLLEAATASLASRRPVELTSVKVPA